MSSVRYDVDGVDEFIAGMVVIDKRVHNDVSNDVKHATKQITSGWRRDAAKKAGKHGRKYPLAIRPEMVTVFEAVIGPLESMDQGGMGMGFEYGTPTTAKKQGWPGAPFLGKKGWFGGPRIGQRVGQNTPQMSMNITCDKEFPAFVKAVGVTMAKDWR